METRSLDMTSQFQNKDLKDEETEEEFLDDNLVGLSGGSNNKTADSTTDTKVAIFEQLHQNIREGLAGHTWEIINYNPLRFIIAHTQHNQIIYASVRNRRNIIYDNRGNDTGKYELLPYLKFRNIIIGSIPTEVISHEDPLRPTERKYTIKFSAHTDKKFVIGPKHLEEIIAELREKALVFMSSGASEALAVIVSAFAKDKKIITNTEVQTPGFYLINGSDINASNSRTVVAYKTNHPTPSEKEVRKCAGLLDELATKYKHKEAFATVINWSIIAPFDYVMKQHKDDWIPWLHLYGSPLTSKTTLGDISCAVWGKYANKNYKIPYTNIDTVPKFGEVLSKSTYPIIVNEVGALNDDKHRPLVEMFKNDIETQTARSKFIHKTTYTEIPSLCACILTGNTQPPSDSGYRRRIIPIQFTRDDEHTEQEMESFKQLMSEKVGPGLCILGNFAANYILDNQRRIILDSKIFDWKLISREILVEFYKTAGKSQPEWIDYSVQETQLVDSKEETDLILRGFFINIVNELYNKHHRSIDYTSKIEDATEVPNLPFSHRLNFCLQHRLIPFLNPALKETEIVITCDLMQELRRLRLDWCISSVAEVARMIQGFEYGQKKLGGRNIRAAYGNKLKFIEFLAVE
jgi:hypothetical protein